ncbi:MAG: stress response translation initiation inhibitor YciH [Thaumarchaeota archaeon]|nr:stress response translation initiation inhibitor YciH [Nitrososphaerota archaeon]
MGTVVCNKCSLPNDLCVCQELDQEESRIVIRLEMRRYRKPTTMIEGLSARQSDLEELAKKLKSRFACGGTAKEGYVLLQGDHRDLVKSHLVKFGYSETSIEVQ